MQLLTELVQTVVSLAPSPTGCTSSCQDGGTEWLKPEGMADPTNGKVVRLNGMNLSHAQMLEGIAGGLPKDNNRQPALIASPARSIYASPILQQLSCSLVWQWHEAALQHHRSQAEQITLPFSFVAHHRAVQSVANCGLNQFSQQLHLCPMHLIGWKVT